MSIIHPFKGKFSTILLFGPPGAGKGTLGKFLSNAGTQFHLSSGDIFRSLAVDSVAGNLFYSFASKGELVPDDAAIEIWKHYVQGLIATNSYLPEKQDLLLDGIPRTLRQATMLSEYIEIRHIIVLQAENLDVLMKRMQNQARLEGNVEDVHSDVIKKRIHSYVANIQEVLSFYPRYLITYINAEQKPLEVLRDVLVRLSHVLSHGPNNGHAK